MDTQSFEDIITNFTKISRIPIMVWDGDEAAFCSSVDGMPVPSEAASQAFLRQTAEKGERQTIDPDGDSLIVGVPVQDGSGIVGALMAYGVSRSSDKASAQAVADFLTSLSDLIGDTLTTRKESEKMAEELGQSFEDLYLYSSLATQVKTLRFSSHILDELISELLETMRSDLAFASLRERREYDTVFSNDVLKQHISHTDGFIAGLLEQIPSDEKTLEENYYILNDSRDLPRYTGLCDAPYRFLAVRIQHGENDYGWLGLVSFNLQEIFRRGELRLLISVAEQIAVVLSNTDLYHDLENFVINVVKSLVYAIEAKDQYTSGHSERVNAYSRLIAEEIGMDDEATDDLNWAAILHDVGKIGIPEAILNKPMDLTDDEYRIVKNHPQKGHDILEPIDQLKRSLPGILYHHERFDGKGYPMGLKGEEIPLMSRIIAIADTYDAISSSRAYRAARPDSEAVDTILKVSGTQLDPELVDAFSRVHRRHPAFRGY